MLSIVTAALAWVGLFITVSVPYALLGTPKYVLGESTNRFEFQSASNTHAVQHAFGIAPEDTIQTALGLLAFRTAYVVSFAVAEAIIYFLACLLSRAVRRYGGIEIRLRPVSR